MLQDATAASANAQRLAINPNSYHSTATKNQNVI
jgi:hypothetical protein